VGQLVRGLEEWLGTPLFVRGASGRSRLTATDAALRALPDIRAGFDRLSAGLERLRQGAASGALAVTVSPAFAAKWLLPRFERFQTACPDTDVRLETQLKPLDFAAQRVDIGVRYGTGHWPGLRAEKLMDEEVFPVCSPALLQAGQLPDQPADLARFTLIHDLSMDGHPGFPSWDAWLRGQGVAGVDTSRGLKINDSASVLQAAMEGRGIALARSVMVQGDLAAGRVLRLFPQIHFPSALAYYIVYRPESASLSRAMAFRDWLLREAAMGMPASPVMG
jgi:LysR family glycine cleavage system transcriptional activator